MPELPEVETVRAALADRVTHRTIQGVNVHCTAVVKGGPATALALLVGQRIAQADRHGKELLIRTAVPPAEGACLCVHLGMTGSLRYWPPGEYTIQKHDHVVWQLDNGGEIVFRDPRRFGFIRPFDSVAALYNQRWRRLGPDAQRITATQLHERLQHTRRAIKVALLNQTILAGMGNIYVDELLFRIGIDPRASACALSQPIVGKMVRAMRGILAQAIRANGSTVRDYRDGIGRPGRFQLQHKVYGRSRERCLICTTFLKTTRIGGRTTVYCPTCQKRGRALLI